MIGHYGLLVPIYVFYVYVYICILDILDEASPNIKYWSGQCSAHQTSVQENMEKKKSGPSRILSKYEEFIITLIRLRLAVFTFFWLIYSAFQMLECLKFLQHGSILCTIF